MPDSDFDHRTIPREHWLERQEAPEDGTSAATDGECDAPPEDGDGSPARPATGSHPTEDITRSRLSRRYLVLKLVQTVWLVAVVLEGMIGIRILLHLFNASREATFYRLVNAVTAPALFPFADLVPARPLFGGMLEVSALVAMVVYLLVTLVVVRSLRILFLWPPR